MGTPFTLGFDQPLALLALPLALLPLTQLLATPLRAGSLHGWPLDPASGALECALRMLGMVAIGALVIALAGPFRPEHEVERHGQGAEVVLLLDRSRSMDQAFINAGLRGTSGGTYHPHYRPSSELEAIAGREGQRAGQTKGQAARRVLADFAAQRSTDRFGMVVFSTLPIRVLDFTQKPEAIQAAIAAGEVGRGLSETDIGLALQEGLRFFEDRAYTGSRILLLVSDGGDHLDPDLRDRLAQQMRRLRVSLYWIYIRSLRSPGLLADRDTPPDQADTVPEYFLHRYFQGLGVPYRAYEAENPQALQRAVDDLNRLENLPITYPDTVPRRQLDGPCLAVALAALLLLGAARLLEVERWR
ncbi:vWA domain-containing protein [Caldimonas sp. KR1-144]|uniref:vWA domain-containing protein n=1 Tax=Caldimonas sp. KR1-144 TaxID=3400911 RepID=UPI003BFFC64D